jgi:Uma2 family endonuclease
VPDVVVSFAAALPRTKDLLNPADVLLVVEVLSPTTRTADLVLKRCEYASAWIPKYWIVAGEARTLTVLALDEVLPDYNVGG